MAEILLSSEQRRRRSRWIVMVLLLVALIAMGFAWWWQRTATSTPTAKDAEVALAKAGIDADERAAIEAVVREYILSNPEILPEAMQRLQDRGASEQIAALRDEVERPFPGAVLGNPNGSVTLVEFTDFACGFCRQSVDDIKALVKEHPELRVVIRELPILSPASEAAARMALAAARQGRYAQFHQAMFSGERPSEESIAAAARKAGLNLESARQVANSPEIDAELRRNMDLASRLGIQGTPAWVVGDRLLNGAVGRDRLDEAIQEARQSA